MANVDVSYKGQIIVTVNNGEEKILKTAGKYCEDNISLQLTGEEPLQGKTYTLETWDEDGEAISIEEYGNRIIPPTNHSYQKSGADNVKTLVIGQGITSIGGSAFARYPKLKEVTLSETVKTLDGLAFQYCSVLEKVTAEGELDYIGIDVFDGTPFYEALTNNEENWENNLLYWGNAVMSCNKQEIGPPVFKAKTRLIAGEAFAGSKMSSINIPEGVISIGDQAFFASKATEIILPSTVINLGKQLFLGEGDSLKNFNLKKVVIKGPVELPMQTFWRCVALEEADLSGSTVIPSRAFEECSNLTTLILGESLIKIDPNDNYYTFGECKKLQTVYYKGTPESWANIDFSSWRSSPGCGSKGYDLYCNNMLLTELTLTEDIKPYVFAYCKSLKKVTINEDINIGKDTFAGTKIAEIEFGENVTSIVGNNSFGSSFTKVILGSNIRTITKGAFFSYSEKQKSLYYNGTLESWCNIEHIEGTEDNNYPLPGLMLMYDLYIDNQKVVNLVIPETITTIKQDSFSMNSGIKTVTIGDNVTHIDPYSFSYCFSLEDISIGKNITQVDEFINSISLCPSLKSISVGADNPVFLTEENVLFNKEKTTLFIYPSSRIGETYTIPSGVTTLNGSSFSQLANLKHLIIPDEVISAEDAISGSGLLTITIGSGMENLGSKPFDSCSSLTTITVNEQNQTYSSENGVLFNKDKTQLLCYPRGKTETSFTIPATVTSLVDYNLYYADNLTVLTFEGTPDNIGSHALPSSITTINVPWAEGAVANAPWGATGATINYNYVGGES